MRKPWRSHKQTSSQPNSAPGSDVEQDIHDVTDPTSSVGTMQMDMHGLSISDNETPPSHSVSGYTTPEEEDDYDDDHKHADKEGKLLSADAPPKPKRRPLLRPRNKRHAYSFQAINSDVLGIVFLEILEATDLPPERNMIRTGFDMDPFVIISFGRKTFRTRVVRHNLNPKWNEKLFFHVLQREDQFSINFALFDWDKISSNDHVAGTTLPVEELIKHAPTADENTGVFPEKAHDMKEYILPLTMVNADKWQNKYSPQLRIRCKFTPYLALRHQFWRSLLRNYDADDSGSISHIELTTMLDSLGSTLSDETIIEFFTKHGQTTDGEKDAQLTFDQAIACLEEQIGRAESDKKRSSSGNESKSPTGATTPTATASEVLAPPQLNTSENSDIPASEMLEDDSDDGVERVITVKECPLCHKPRLNKKAEVDIVTHLAICASQDWRAINRIVMGNFVTPAQAQRKWYTKVISKVYTGSYRIGADSANILVQDRLTGQLLEEKMSTYVRLGIRLLYKGLKSSRMEGNRIRKLLASLSIKQGRKYDSPASTREIKAFIAFHGLDMNEVLEPTENFHNFNEFFYRKLKPDARKCSSPEDPTVVVSPADCRMMAFQTISQATSLWIKGREFTISRLLGPNFSSIAEQYDHGSIGIFRLAPQDYHRFHVPVDGVLGKPVHISGQYYTVNPMAIRSAIDVYSENVRTIVPIQSDVFGQVIVVCVGAMMVGSTVITAKEGEHVKRTDELGYFKFGGSTLLVLFKPNVFVWDDDLRENAKTALETLVRVGMHVGKAVIKPTVV